MIASSQSHCLTQMDNLRSSLLSLSLLGFILQLLPTADVWSHEPICQAATCAGPNLPMPPIVLHPRCCGIQSTIETQYVRRISELFVNLPDAPVLMARNPNPALRQYPRPFGLSLSGNTRSESFWKKSSGIHAATEVP